MLRDYTPTDRKGRPIYYKKSKIPPNLKTKDEIEEMGLKIPKGVKSIAVYRYNDGTHTWKYTSQRALYDMGVIAPDMTFEVQEVEEVVKPKTKKQKKATKKKHRSVAKTKTDDEDVLSWLRDHEIGAYETVLRLAVDKPTGDDEDDDLSSLFD